MEFSSCLRVSDGQTCGSIGFWVRWSLILWVVCRGSLVKERVCGLGMM